MQKTRIDPATLLIGAAGALFLLLLPAKFLWLTSVGGFAVLLTLLSYDAEGYRSVVQSLAFAAAVAVASAVTAFAPVSFIAGDAEKVANWLPLIWAGAVLVIWIIDCVRMSSRQTYGSQVSVPSSTAFQFYPATAPAPAPAPAPMRGPSLNMPVAPPPPQPASSSAPVLVRPEQPVSNFNPPSVPSSTVVAPSAPAAEPEPAFVEETRPSVSLTPSLESPEAAPLPIAATTAAAAPSPAPTAIFPQPPAAPGREALIYVNLVGEGLNVLRTVQAEHLGKDYYRIVESMPEGETWEFLPGQVVKCKKKNLSSGKALVAIEEAPRAQ